LELVEPEPVVLLPVVPVAPVLPLEPVLLLPLIPELPLEPLLPDVCAIETVAAPTSAAATAAHRTFIVIVGLLNIEGEEMLQAKDVQMACRHPAASRSGNCDSPVAGRTLSGRRDACAPEKPARTGAARPRTAP
jgi:hypothetical protein